MSLSAVSPGHLLPTQIYNPEMAVSLGRDAPERAKGASYGVYVDV